MVDTHTIFAEMDAALATRGFRSEEEHEAPEAFGSRSRLYRRAPREALVLIWDGRDGWLILRGGVPWRDLAIVLDVREASETPAEIVAALLRDAAQADDVSPAI